MNKQNFYRHGDLGLVQVDKMPAGLDVSKSNVLLENGSGGHSHTFKGGKFYPKVEGDFVLGYLFASKTKLYHPEHGGKKTGNLKEATIKDGIYEVRKQNEHTPNGLKPVID